MIDSKNNTETKASHNAIVLRKRAVSIMLLNDDVIDRTGKQVSSNTVHDVKAIINTVNTR